MGLLSKFSFFGFPKCLKFLRQLLLNCALNFCNLAWQTNRLLHFLRNKWEFFWGKSNTMQMDDDLLSLTLPGPSIICVFKKSLFFSSGEFHLENASHTQRRRRRTKRLHFAVHQMILGPAPAAKFRKDFPPSFSLLFSCRAHTASAYILQSFDLHY